MVVRRFGARDSLEGAAETRQRLSRQALSPTEPQWSNGRSPTGADSLHVLNQSLIYGNRSLQHNTLSYPYSCLLGHMVPL